MAKRKNRHFISKPHNRLCISNIASNAQNSKISHQRFLRALNEEY